LVPSSTGPPSRHVDTVFLLEAGLRHHEARIGDVGPVGGDLAARLWAGVGSRAGEGADEGAQKTEKHGQTEGLKHSPTLANNTGLLAQRPPPATLSKKKSCPVSSRRENVRMYDINL
jgi:hypothetical protein